MSGHSSYFQNQHNNNIDAELPGLIDKHRKFDIRFISTYQIDVQERCNFSVLAMELCLSSINPSK